MDGSLTADTNMIHPFYSSYGIKAIRLSMDLIDNAHEHDIVRTSAQALLTGDEVMVSADFSRQDFLNYFPTNLRNKWDGQPNCNERAFHIRDLTGVHCR